MTTQIIEEREELKTLLGNENYLTFIDVVLNHSGKVIQKLTRRRRRVSIYWSAALICTVILGVGLGISALFGELTYSRLAILKIEILGVALAFLSLVIFKNAQDIVIHKIRNDIIDSIEDENNLIDLQNWMYLLSNVKANLIFCIIYALIFGYVIGQELVGYGSFFLVFSVAFIWGIPMYFLLVFILLPYRLGRYQFHLYFAVPSSSKVIYDLSRLFGGLVYLYATVAAGSMVFIAYSGLLPSLFLPSILVAWLPIALLFATNQYALSTIIMRGKWNTLLEIQNKVEDIQRQEDLTQKDVMEKAVHLMEYHDRIKDTKNSALDVRAGLDFLNSLLLPVIGFFIGNIDLPTVKAIFENTKGWLIP